MVGRRSSKGEKAGQKRQGGRQGVRACTWRYFRENISGGEGGRDEVPTNWGGGGGRGEGEGGGGRGEGGGGRGEGGGGRGGGEGGRGEGGGGSIVV